jgi:hypothetical protein
VHVCVLLERKYSKSVGPQGQRVQQRKRSARRQEKRRRRSTDKPYTHLTQLEIDGLRKIVAWLRSLPDNKRCIPADIPDSDALLADVEVSAWLYCDYIHKFRRCCFLHSD